MARRPNVKVHTTKPFVVYVTYPSSSKEYAYLCNFPARQGDMLFSNGTRVVVQRTADHDPLATKYVTTIPDPTVLAQRDRRFAIIRRLNEIEASQKELDRYASLARVSPEAKRLIAELKRITQ